MSVYLGSQGPALGVVNEHERTRKVYFLKVQVSPSAGDILSTYFVRSVSHFP